MKNIRKIFMRDLKGLIKNPFALIIAIGLCILPSLYAWFNIYSNWDPYANTSNIKIAIVSEDKGVKEEDGSYVNMGQEVVEDMKAKTTIAWTEVSSAKEAKEGVYAGKYYAAVVIAEDFSSAIYHSLEEEFLENPRITYYENEKKNAVATKITDSAVSSLKQSTNEKFIEAVVSSALEKTNVIAEDLENDDGMETLEGKLRRLNSSLNSYQDLILLLLASNDELTEAMDDAQKEIPEISNSIKKGASSITDAEANLKKTQTSLNDFSANVTAKLSAIEASINRISNEITSASLSEDAKSIVENATLAATDTEKLVQQIQELQTVLNNLAEGSPEKEAAKAELESVLNALGALSNGAEDVKNRLETILNEKIEEGTNTEGGQKADELASAGVELITESVRNSLSECNATIEKMKNLYSNTLVPEMNNVIQNMSEVLKNVAEVLNNLGDNVGSLSSIFEGIDTTVSSTNGSLSQILEVIETVNGKIEKLIERLENAQGDERANILLDVLGGDPETYGKYFAAPVEMKTEAVYPIENYGSAMTPFYSVLAIWVGMTILVSIIKVHAEPKDLEDVKPYQLFFGRYLMFFLLSQLQTAIIVWGDIHILHCQMLYPGKFFFATVLTSLTFSLLIYSLTLSFGDVGKAIAVVVMVIQIAGSSGTFPIELLPSVYQNIYIFFPFPYAINAIRETIGGMYADTYVMSLLKLLIFAVAALLIGLVIRIPFVGIGHFMEERMEDTKMM